MIIVLVAVTNVILMGLATVMLMERGQGIGSNMALSLLAGSMGAMLGAMACKIVGITYGQFAAGALQCLLDLLSLSIIALYIASPMLSARSNAKHLERKRIAQLEVERLKALDPVVFAGKWLPDTTDAVSAASASASMTRFMERTSDAMNQNVIDLRVLCGHVPEIVRLANEAIAGQDEELRGPTARRTIARIVSIGDAVEEARKTLRSPEEDLLDARLRYVDERVDARLSSIA